MKCKCVHSLMSCADLLFVLISIHAWPFKACAVYSFESITVINSAILLTIWSINMQRIRPLSCGYFGPQLVDLIVTCTKSADMTYSTPYPKIWGVACILFWGHLPLERFFVLWEVPFVIKLVTLVFGFKNAGSENTCWSQQNTCP